MDVARLPENRGKNRYNNILPCEYGPVMREEEAPVTMVTVMSA